MSLHMNTEFVV